MQHASTTEPASWTQEKLCEHLNVERSAITKIVKRTGLESIGGKYPWRRVLRAVHRTEGYLLAEHLDALKARHASPALHAITDLEEDLKQPLWDFARMATAMGYRPNTLSRKIREGRITLPFPVIQLGPRLRHYRPLDVRLWRDDQLLLDLPKPIDPTPTIPAQSAETQAPDDPGEALEKALFGG
ncbi:hypothetical protein [Limimaricola litoreus]|uniref:Uncharacterized protein n=1 Tax=Limimaricola litoreus TaxID=2955316 RepID=A0A9X2FUW2_9RHOB|nr:hypothetical protein [Limimaricola litoreus]MCP1168906.1 hypothetical protein [Limimaricola litoreus]